MQTICYDHKGNEVKHIYSYVDYDGYSDRTTTVSTYDSKNNLIKEVETDKSNDGTSKTVRTYTYDSKGNQTSIKTQWKDSEGQSGKITDLCTYNSKGKLEKEVYKRNENGSVYKCVDTYTYDSSTDEDCNYTKTTEKSSGNSSSL